MSTRALTFLVLITTILSSGCHQLVHERYYTLESSGFVAADADPYGGSGPVLRLTSIEENVELRVQVDDYSIYPWLGNLVLPYVWVVPMFLVGWIGYEPLANDTVTMNIWLSDAQRAKHELAIDPAAVRLRVEGGPWIEPSEVRPRGSFMLRLQYELPADFGPVLEWVPDGILVDDQRYRFAPVTLRRTKRWSQKVAG